MNEKKKLDEVYIDELLYQVVQTGYSELHLDVGRPPVMTGYETGDLTELTEYENLQSALIQRMAYDLLTDEQIAAFEEEGILIFTYQARTLARFSVFLARDSESVQATFHVLP